MSSIFVKKRIFKVFIILAVVILSLLLRIGYIQFVRGDELQEKAVDNRLREVPVEAKRGVIADRNEKELAVSMSADSIGAFPPQVRKSGSEKEIASKLAKILEMDEEEVYNKITKNSAFVWIKRKVEDFDKGQKIKEMDLEGIKVFEESQRFYPNDTLASHVLGFAGLDNQGLEGIEHTFNEELSGIPGNIVIEFDAAGRELPQAVHRYTSPEDGNDLVLTLDSTIQYIVERELDQLMNSEVDPENATIVVMQPDTGEILALGSRPAYNPNEYSKYPEDTWRNIAVSNSYEPGSTFKIITAASALEENIIKEGEKFHDPGYIKVGSEKIRCTRPHGTQTFAEGIKNSCNPVLVKAGLRMFEKEKGLFYNYIRGFGFGKETGINLPGETKGMLIAEDQLREINIATISIGQGISVTPIQLITGVSAVANGGTLMEPRLVKEIRDSKGEIIEKYSPEEVRKVISEETSRELRLMLENVVSDGTGTRAYIDGYRVAGKTGTAQKAGLGGYTEGKYVASFVGFAPANQPEVAVLVAIDEPKGYPYHGGTVAAPIFKRVMEDTLKHLGVSRQKTEIDQSGDSSEEQEQPAEGVTVPNVKDISIEEAQNELNKAGLFASIEGEGDKVLSQVPSAGAVVEEGTKVILYVSGSEESLVVPDVTGKRVYEAVRILEDLGLQLNSEGSGFAKSQNPAPGTRVEKGTEIEVRFTNED